MARGNIVRKTYLTCSRGKWRERVKKGTPGSMERTVTPDDKPSYQVHEIVNDYVSGIIKSIEIRDDDKGYGRQWMIVIQDGEEILALQFPYDSGYAFAFLSKLPCAIVHESISFFPYYFEEERKARLVLKQDNQNMPSFFTKEEPKGFPAFPQDTTNKDEITVWKIEAMNFLIRYLNKHIIPLLPGKPDEKKIEETAESRARDAAESMAEETTESDAERGNISPPSQDDVPPEITSSRVDNNNDDLPF